MEILSGQQVKGYEFIEQVGAGGFGAVYKARQTTTFEREVAIKVILPQYANQPEFIRRFEIEAQVISCLEHMNIVPLYDYWRDTEGAYLVMRWLRGGSLKDALQNQTYDLEATIRVTEQIAGALSVAHRHHIIHRDLKPGNILLDEDGNAYLADFGIAKDVGATDEPITNPDQLVGSPDYLAPEQARGDPVTPQTDIYSLGVVLYEILTGTHPFSGLSPVEQLLKHLNEPLPNITTLPDGIQDEINRIIRRATAKQPEDRYPSVLAMLQDFHEVVGLVGTTADDDVTSMLTPRELDIARLILKEMNNQEIADALVITRETVRWYIRQINHKLNVASRKRLVEKLTALGIGIDAPHTGSLSATSLKDLPPPPNPYKGLRAFQVGDANDFFGRESIIDKLINRMCENKPYARFLAIVGPSGSGKSSLAKAGLIPTLWRGAIPGSEQWYIVEMLPSDRPLHKLEVALARVIDSQAVNLRDHLQQDEQGLLHVVDLILPDDGRELVVIIDQFEEVFTLLQDETQRLHFLKLLHTAVTGDRSRVRVVITLRADFYDRPLLYPEFGQLVRDRAETILPLTAQELEHAIRKPAQNVGVKFEDGLVNTIADEVSHQPGALPLLQYALTELFERHTNHTLTHQAYREIGGTVGALAKRAEELFCELSDEAQVITRQMFLRLVTLGEGVEDTRRRTPRDELDAVTNNTDLLADIIDTLVDYRLLSLDHDPITRTSTVEVAHEAILREWERLRNWLNESRDHIRQQRLLSGAAQEWERAGFESSYLLSGSRLTQFANWHDQTDVAFTPQEQTYLETSITEEARRTLRQRRTRIFAFAILSLIAVVMTILAFVANGQRGRAEDEKDRAETAEQEALRQASIGLASQSRLELENGDQDRAVLLALEALEGYPYTAQAESALADVVEAYIPSTELPSELGLGATRLAVWSPDGTRIALAPQFITSEGSEQDLIHIRDTNSESLLVTLSLEVLGCRASDIEWSPGGEYLATTYTRALFSSSDCLALPTIWDANTGDILFQLEGHMGEVYSIDWSPDGTRLLTAGADGITRLWDGETGDEKVVFTGHTDAVRGAVWSPDARSIATVSMDGTARIWDVATGTETPPALQHIVGVTGVDWSPDGQHVVTAGEDGLARLWDIQTGELVTILHGDTSELAEVYFSPDGRRILTRSKSNLTSIWDTETGAVILSLPQSQNVEIGSQWSPDGKHVVAMGRIWDISAQPPILVGHTNTITTGMWTPDGSRIVTISWDGTARIWDATTGDQLLVLDHPNMIWYGSLSPDGTRLVTSNVDGHARIWDTSSGELLLEVSLASPEALLADAAWSPDGTQIFSFDVTGHAFVWNAETGEVLTALDSEAAFAQLGPDESFCVIFRPSWSPDGTRIATGCWMKNVGTGPLIWDAISGELLMALEDIGGVEDSTHYVDWSPDGTRLVSSHHSGNQHVWDAITGELLQTFSGLTAISHTGTWSPSGTRIASGDTNGLVKVWDPLTGMEVRSFQVPFGVFTIHWSPDERNIIITGQGNIPVIRRVWSSTQALIDEAHECCVTRDLTPEEREQFGLPTRDD